MTSRPGICITGAARRVGAVLSRHFARQGYDIALHYHRSEAAAQELKKEIEALGVSCSLISHDVSDIGGIPSMMDKVHKALPHCAGLINNASIFERASFMETDEALFDRQFDVNFKAPFFLTQAFARRFGKGSVINIIDAGIVKTQGSHFAYLLSKKALAEFTVMAARQLGPHIRVNAVCPGCILPADAQDAEYVDRVRDHMPLKSHPTTDELAQSVYWLATQPHITGQLLYIDGGMHAL